MAAITEEIFTKKFTKAEAWNAYQQLLSEKESLDSIKQTVSDALSKVKTLEDRIVKLEGELSVAKNANVLLKKEVVNGERKRRHDNQYTRLENVEVAGIPATIQTDALEETVISVAKEIGVELAPSDVSACHRLKGDSTIIRFVSRKHADALFSNAKKLKGKNLSAILGEGHSPVYINANLCPEFRSMRWKAKRLKEAGLIASFGTNRRGVYVQKTEGADKKSVDVDSDLDPFLGDKSLQDILHPSNDQ